MKLSDYIAQNGDREIDSEKLDEVLQIKRNKVWRPKEGDIYWYLDKVGKICIDVWIESNIDYCKYEIGNIFPTKEAAQAHVEYLKTRAALRRYAQEHNDREIDWRDTEQNKWYIYYNYYEKRNKISCANSCRDAGQIYFASQETAEAAIEEIGDARIKQYLLYDEEELNTNLCNHFWDVFKARDKNGKIITIYKCQKCNAEEILKYPIKGDDSV